MNQRQLSDHFPFVRIRILHPESQHEVVLEAMVDTGFDGSLILPGSFAARLGRPDSSTIWTLADGSVVEALAYDVEIDVLGIAGAHLAIASVMGSEVLVGRSLTDRFRLILDHGQQLIVEA